MVTVATAVFSKQMGSLIKWIGCNVVAVNVVGADAVGVSQGGKELLPGEEFGLLHAGVSVLLVQRLVGCSSCTVDIVSLITEKLCDALDS